MKTFKHSGDMGDVIFSLPAMRALGGGILYLDPEGGETSPLVGWPGHTRTKLNVPFIESVTPLLELQDYITEVHHWDGEAVDHDLDNFRRFADGRMNLAESHLMAFGLSTAIQKEQWMTVTPNRVAKYVLSRSLRYHGNYEFWEQLRPEVVADAVFVGLDVEYEYFKLVFGYQVPHFKTQTIQDAAEVLAGSDYYFANQSLLSALGQAMKLDMTVELYRETKTNMFHRDNARYV